MSLRDVLRNVRDALEESGVPYMVTGSIASSVHGVPRATQDIDLVIEPTREQLLALMDKFTEPAYDADRDDAFDRKARPFSKREFDRRESPILGVSVYAATPEL